MYIIPIAIRMLCVIYVNFESCYNFCFLIVDLLKNQKCKLWKLF